MAGDLRRRLDRCRQRLAPRAPEPLRIRLCWADDPEPPEPGARRIVLTWDDPEPSDRDAEPSADR